jgi:hypothetical protein
MILRVAAARRHPAKASCPEELFVPNMPPHLALPGGLAVHLALIRGLYTTD